MKIRNISQQQKEFYQNLKKSLQNGGDYVLKSSAATTDLVVLNMKKDVVLYKIVTPDERKNVELWKSKIKDIYVLAWWRATYVLIYLDENFNEIKREEISLK